MVQGHCCFVCFSINQTYAGFYCVAQNFCGSLFLQIAILCILRELIIVIRKDWFFLLEINFCDLQKVPDKSKIIFWFLLRKCNQIINNNYLLFQYHICNYVIITYTCMIFFKQYYGVLTLCNQ